MKEPNQEHSLLNFGVVKCAWEEHYEQKNLLIQCKNQRNLKNLQKHKTKTSSSSFICKRLKTPQTETWQLKTKPKTINQLQQSIDCIPNIVSQMHTVLFTSRDNFTDTAKIYAAIKARPVRIGGGKEKVHSL